MYFYVELTRKILVVYSLVMLILGGGGCEEVSFEVCNLSTFWCI